MAALALGVAVGYRLRGRKLNLNRVLTGFILLLIFSLGFSIGSNGALLEALPQVGLASAVLLAAALFFSILFLKAARRVARV